MVKKSTDAILDASRNFADGASDMVPGDKEQVDKMIDQAFDLTERVLKVQRDFAKQVVDTVTPPIGGDSADS
jgi:hypothetical protein